MNFFSSGYSDVSTLMFGSLQIRRINLEEHKHMFVKRWGRFTVSYIGNKEKIFSKQVWGTYFLFTNLHNETFQVKLTTSVCRAVSVNTFIHSTLYCITPYEFCHHVRIRRSSGNSRSSGSFSTIYSSVENLNRPTKQEPLVVFILFSILLYLPCKPNK
jgi:hypothetical protein